MLTDDDLLYQAFRIMVTHLPASWIEKDGKTTPKAIALRDALASAFKTMRKEGVEELWQAFPGRGCRSKREWKEWGDKILELMMK